MKGNSEIIYYSPQCGDEVNIHHYSLVLHLKQNQHGQVLAVKFSFDRIKLLFVLLDMVMVMVMDMVQWYILKLFFIKKLV